MYISITQAKAKFSEIINQVRNGQEVVVTCMGKPVVRISRYDLAKGCCRLGLMAGEATIPENFSTWPEEEMQSFGLED